MKMLVSNSSSEVTVSTVGVRPIRLRLGPVRFAMSEAEAIDLATRLADAVAERRRTAVTTPAAPEEGV
jgi:hypothetical protein